MSIGISWATKIWHWDEWHIAMHSRLSRHKQITISGLTSWIGAIYKDMKIKIRKKNGKIRSN